MKKILIAYNSMNIGGSTTSLIGFLNSLDYSKFSVDLQLYENIGPYLDMIPNEVNILVPARQFSKNKYVGIIQRCIHPIYWKAYFKSKYYNSKFPKTLASSQITARARASTSKKNNNYYDIAIGYLEMWSNYYVLENINAKKKIAWIHVDYEKAGLCFEAEEGCFDKFDNIVFVADKCLENFCKSHPELKNKTCCIENILDKSLVQKRSLMPIESIYIKNRVNIITVCRIEFKHKGLDRALKVFLKLKREGKDFVWHIIGDGHNFYDLKQMIESNNLEDCIILHGSKENPLPYVKDMDLFLLPSLYEGKPMVVTEAQMLNIPVLATNYSSAEEQIISGYDGLIVENSEEGIYQGLKSVIENIDALNNWRKNLESKQWNYSLIISKINSLVME